LGVPAAVVRERRDGVAAVLQELPELVRRRDATGEPAPHRHDGDRLVGGARGRRRDGGGEGGVRAFAPALGGEGAGQGVGGGMVEQQRGVEAHTGGRRQAVAELEGHQRIEAELLERPIGDRGGGGREAQDGGGLGAYQLEQRAQAVLCRECGEAVR